MGDFFSTLAAGLREAASTDWRVLARPAQLPPDDFAVWLLLAGRGSGKTWAAAHYVNELASSGQVKRIALVGATASDVRFTMVEGFRGF